MVGFGAVGQELARLLKDDARLRITQIVATPKSIDRVCGVAEQLAPHATVTTAIDASAEKRPDLVAECAGHGAIMAHVIPALEAGIPCVVASVGALAEHDTYTLIESAAQRGRARVQLISGAVGALDALAAARIGGLDRVVYTGRKPPRSWQGTPADRVCDLSQLAAPCVVFQGTARAAALAFPKNANVAASVALAGLGLDDTEVCLMADPAVERNIHRIDATGAFGRLELHLENFALSANPKTSALTVYSLVRAVRNASAGIVF